ncbi:hypothetical protein [Truepera radiovictrix]|uniref:hypothetical protein n=1 Tax=Truepera radiovictrix TaxID=332249 RepID=UPI0011D125E2|nr:hypothetical protein [Truepera radiovictrix]WMT55936.1 hypothetical protein RCV51_07895 [Truepera radiovictrix]
MRLLGVLLALSACAPAADVAQTPPTTYAGPYDAVFSATLQLVTQDPGVPGYNPGGINGYWRAPSGPWLVTSSDRQAGLIAAQARSQAAGFIGSGAAPDVHSVNILIVPLSEDPPRTQVTVQGTARSRLLQNRLQRALTERFGRVP